MIGVQTDSLCGPAGFTPADQGLATNDARPDEAAPIRPRVGGSPVWQLGIARCSSHGQPLLEVVKPGFHWHEASGGPKRQFVLSAVAKPGVHRREAGWEPRISKTQSRHSNSCLKRPPFRQLHYILIMLSTKMPHRIPDWTDRTRSSGFRRNPPESPSRIRSRTRTMRNEACITGMRSLLSGEVEPN